VYWLGERENVALLLRCFDVFIQTSLFEGMSNTILEAMATGLPIIATRTGGNEELIVSSRNGALVPVGDAKALSQSLATYLSNPRLCRIHGARGREKVLKDFDLSLMASRYAALYEE
jgi:glycosyltransferase involved in cell wall biosynthesis